MASVVVGVAVLTTKIELVMSRTRNIVMVDLAFMVITHWKESPYSQTILFLRIKSILGWEGCDFSKFCSAKPTRTSLIFLNK